MNNALDKQMHERMLARGVAESMLRAGGKLPAKPYDIGLWASLAGTAVVIGIIGVIAAYTGVAA